MHPYLQFSDDDDAKYAAAERFVGWLERTAMAQARGDNETFSPVGPLGRFWLGRLGPKDVVTRQDDRGDRLEPCAVGLRVIPSTPGPWEFSVKVEFCTWHREATEKGAALRWQWRKSKPTETVIQLHIPEDFGEHIVGQAELATALQKIDSGKLNAEVRVRILRQVGNFKALEVCLVNASQEIEELADGRLFECSLSLLELKTQPFELEALPDSFRYERKVDAFGINCGAKRDDYGIHTTDAPATSRPRPKYWAVEEPEPDLNFESLALDPVSAGFELLASFERWAESAWSANTLGERAVREEWSAEMRNEAVQAQKQFNEELARVRYGHELLTSNSNLRRAFQAMNKSMAVSAAGKYQAWRPFQFAFLLANLKCVIEPTSESSIVDVVWFATGGGKTETYLGLLLTAAFLDRIRGKVSGVTAWSRFPLRMLSLQQTQRFANALAAGELVRRGMDLGGDEFSLGFLVGGGATPNRIKKESERDNEDADKISEQQNPYRLLEHCPFCRNKSVVTRFDRSTWRLIHVCEASACPNEAKPLPLFVVDDEIWRFLPTVVIGTLDKAANIARQSGMRGLLGAPWGKCSRPGHGYTYAKRGGFPHGCLVPDCRGGEPQALPMAQELYAPMFRLQDELHLLRDSLGAVDSHYELALDSLQHDINGSVPKILASSATLTGYEKQIETLYRRSARVFPQPSPKDGQGFWTSDSDRLMRRYVALAPRRLTVEFAIDRLIVSLQSATRSLLHNPEVICAELGIDVLFAEFLIQIYGTNVVYGNTLQDIDAVLRSSETQLAELSPQPNVASLTGRTQFDEVRATLARLEKPEEEFAARLHLIAASSMMSHGVDIDRLNIMIMLAFPLGVAEFIQATARVGRRWPALVIVVPKMTRARDASVYRAFPEFVSHGDRFVEAIPITRKSRRVLERTIAGLEMSRIGLLHEPIAGQRLVTIKDFNAYVRSHPDTLHSDRIAIQKALGIEDDDQFVVDQLKAWFSGFERNLSEPPADARFISELSPTGPAMTSLRDVEEQVPIKGDSAR